MKKKIASFNLLVLLQHQKQCYTLLNEHEHIVNWEKDLQLQYSSSVGTNSIDAVTKKKQLV